MKKRKKEFLITEDFLDVMTLDEIKDKVNSCHPGASHALMILDGAPISLKDGNMLYITETFQVRFNINYYAIKEVAFKQMIELAWEPKHVFDARRAYESLKHKEFVAKSALEMLEHKEKLIASGATLPKPKLEKKDPKKTDPENKSIILCDNGTVQLRSYASFKNKIKSVRGGFEFAEILPEVRYFVKKPDGSIFEIDPNKDPKIKTAMEAARKTARSVTKKKGGGVTLCVWPKVQNVLNIW